jgi:hypothetical protein
MILNLNRSALSFGFPLLVGATIGVTLLYYFYSGIDPNIKFGDFALGAENSSSFDSHFVDGVQIHCYDLTDDDKCIDGYKKSRPGEDVTLWLGNSQVFIINQMKQGNMTASHTLHQNAKVDSKYFMTFSQPNANLQEHYILFEYLAQKLPVTTLVLPIVFDDMRETGIRNTLIGVFKDQSVLKRIVSTEIGRKLSENEGDQDLAGNDMSALQDTIQEQSEKYLNSELDKIWRVWSERPKLRGSLLSNLYLYRNWLLGVNASSIRRIIPGRYAVNMQALNAILKSARELKIRVLLYIPPLRDDVKIPYNLDQYDNFKSDIQSIATRHNAEFANLESLVPAKYWGTKDATSIGGGQELDFMHFQVGGHRLLANSLYGKLKNLWKKVNDYDF